MIITRTPFRISLIGGGSDLADFYTREQGAVVSFAINKYMYISSHDYFEPNKTRVKYSKTETVDKASELTHPILRVVLEKFGLSGLEVSSIADIPSGTGMGSSSAFTVGLLQNLYAKKNQYRTKEQLAAEACEIEIDILKEPIGKQDQYAASFGGMNHIVFHKNHLVEVKPVLISRDKLSELESRLVLFYTGVTRATASVLTEQKNNLISSGEKFKAQCEMVKWVEPCVGALTEGRWDLVGEALHANWELKKSLASGISNPEFDLIYSLAMKNGAIGGKILGAGGGGFFLFLCGQGQKENLISSLKNLRHFNFQIDFSGSQVIFYQI